MFMPPSNSFHRSLRISGICFAALAATAFAAPPAGTFALNAAFSSFSPEGVNHVWEER